MVPFMKESMQFVVKPDVVDKGKTREQFQNLDLSDSSNLLSSREIYLGFGVDQIIKKLTREDIVTTAQINQFVEGAKSFVIATLLMLLQRSPLSSVVVRCSALFDPKNIILTSKSILQKRLKNLLSHLLELNIFSPSPSVTTQ